jgi:hypothetical protein
LFRRSIWLTGRRKVFATHTPADPIGLAPLQLPPQLCPRHLTSTSPTA